ncbi:hypothetical protein [Parvibaculum sp.]|uniref:hypothetical protein n=1 Tax=Parvibaculum sp. TaxID=2024848 RepID=UPI000C4B7736|nr:hypothetical protein [Parvibaculum sp.]MAM95695.1 hypothetical protein [Parvibaculum sp.]HCX68559.1 hypothetical protein [Rhodobiaceae bacterium]|tara:strand:- start:22132 stop:22596 length:465 start_codon:yes stop_codon:yes gene_type:complete
MGFRSPGADRRFLSETMQQLRLAPQAGVIQFIVGDAAPEIGAHTAGAYTASRHYAAEPWHKLTAALLLLEDIAEWLGSGEGLADPELAGVREQAIAALDAFGLAPGDLKAELTNDTDTTRHSPGCPESGTTDDNCHHVGKAHGVRKGAGGEGTM